MRTPTIKREFYGWAILDKFGVATQTIHAKHNHFGSIETRTAIENIDEILKIQDREWAGLAPHTVAKLYSEVDVPVIPPAILAKTIVDGLRDLLKSYRAEFTLESQEMRLTGRGFNVLTDTCEEESDDISLSNICTRNKDCLEFLDKLNSFLQKYYAEFVSSDHTFFVYTDTVSISVIQDDDDDAESTLNHCSEFRCFDKRANAPITI